MGGGGKGMHVKGSCLSRPLDLPTGVGGGRGGGTGSGRERGDRNRRKVGREVGLNSSKILGPYLRVALKVSLISRSSYCGAWCPESGSFSRVSAPMAGVGVEMGFGDFTLKGMTETCCAPIRFKALSA